MTSRGSSEVSLPAVVYFWTVKETEEWLRKRRPRLALKYGNLFTKNCINGRVLMDLTENDLERIGVKNPEERQLLLLEIRKERLHYDLKELSELSKA